MKRLQLLILFQLLPFLLLCQSMQVEEYNQERLRLNRVGMSILGGWAATNIAVSSFSLNGANPEVKAFHQMNIGWNAVNLLIAGFGYYSASQNPGDLSLLESLKEGESMKNILLFNTGLDVGYMLGGLYLMERGKNSTDKKDQFTGFGKAVLMNGAFLFTFDAIMVWLHSQALNTQLYAFASHVQASPSGIKLSFTF